MFLSITSLELSVLNTEGLVTEDIKSVPLKCEFFAGISLRASISHGLRMSVPFSGFKICVQENCPELPGLLSCQDEPERPPGSAPPTTESKQKAEARTTETGGTGAMRGAGRRALGGKRLCGLRALSPSAPASSTRNGHSVSLPGLFIVA